VEYTHSLDYDAAAAGPTVRGMTVPAGSPPGEVLTDARDVDWSQPARTGPDAYSAQPNSRRVSEPTNSGSARVGRSRDAVIHEHHNGGNGPLSPWRLLVQDASWVSTEKVSKEKVTT
jgi:hypothetical protein